MVEFPELKNDLILRAARGEVTERAPVWVMRQAGRYLPEFREVRKQHEFFKVCQTPELACEVTLQPIRRYAGLVDAAIIFSDILVVPQAMGLEVTMHPGEGPKLPQPLMDPTHLERLSASVDVHKELGYVFDAITLTRKELKGQVPLIGFSGAPWTLMAYMVEGGGSKSFTGVKTWLFKYPTETKELLKRIGEVCIDYMVAQVQAGAQMLQLFDTWASELTPHDFIEFLIPTYKHIGAGIRAKLAAAGVPCPPLSLYPKGANHSVAIIAKESGWDVLGLDWCIDPVEAREQVGDSMALQGNLDPGVLCGSPEAIEKEVERMAKAFKQGTGGQSKGWIANLGHGITPGIDPENLATFFRAVHKYTSTST